MNGQKKIKVLHIIPSLVNGGAERLLIDIIKHTNLEKFSPLVLVFKTKGDLYEEMAATGVPLFAYTKKYKIDFKNFLKIYQTIKNEKPDIVHTHLGGDIYGRLAAHWLKVPVIISTEHNLNKKEHWLVTKAKQWTAPWANVIIAVSEAVKRDASKRYNVDPTRFTVIYNGIDTNRYKITQRKDDNDIFTIGAAGRFVEQKGFKYLIEAIKKLVEKDRQIQCIIKGDGYLREDLEKCIKQYKLESVVLLPGTDSNLSDYYSTLDVFVIPSIWEGLGLVALEAGTAGVPLIASNIDGLKEIIEDGVDGLLVPVEDSRALADRIMYVMDNPDQSQMLANHLQAKVREKFSIESMVKQYEILYEILLR